MQQEQQTSGFLTIPTLFDHVRNNLLCNGRQTYYQRIIYVASHKNSASLSVSSDRLKLFLLDLIGAINRDSIDDKLTGLLVTYDMHSVHMLEGPENCMAKYFRGLRDEMDKYFKHTKIVLVYNNINQRFFNRIKYKVNTHHPQHPQTMFATPSMENHNQQTYQLIKCVTELCLKLKYDEEFSDFTNYNEELTEIYGNLTPNIELIDFILTMAQLKSVEQFCNEFDSVPEFKNYNEHVWPIPHDLIPNNIFDWNKYDVNLLADTRNTEAMSSNMH